MKTTVNNAAAQVSALVQGDNFSAAFDLARLFTGPMLCAGQFCEVDAMIHAFEGEHLRILCGDRDAVLDELIDGEGEYSSALLAQGMIDDDLAPFDRYLEWVQAVTIPEALAEQGDSDTDFRNLFESCFEMVAEFA